MKIKSEKGYTGIDIAIAVVVIFIFSSLIALASYQFSSTSKQIELKSQATELAIGTIENLKNIDFEEAESQAETNQEIQEGFFQTILVQDYAEIDSTKESGYVKKITVQIQYKFKKEIETVELSTIISKEK